MQGSVYYNNNNTLFIKLFKVLFIKIISQHFKATTKDNQFRKTTSFMRWKVMRGSGKLMA
jgi:hypothetical protein